MDEMEMRTLLAVILSVLIIIIFQFISAKRYPIERKEAGDKEAPGVVRTHAEGTAKTPQMITQDQRVVVETPLYRAILNEEDGSLISLELLKYKDKIGKDGKPIDILVEDGKSGVIKTDMMEPGSEKPKYKSSTKNAVIKGGKGDVIFQWTGPKGVQIIKTYTFYADRYLIDIEVEARGFESSSSALWFQCSLPDVGKKQDEMYFTRGIWFDGKEFGVKEKGKWDESGSLKKDVLWAGIDSKYFLIAAISKNRAKATFSKRNAQAVIELTNMAKENGKFMIKIFAGPKEMDLLKEIGSGLERTIDFGYFGFIARPFLYILKFFYRITGNYGYAIIILTLIIKIIFFPLSIYQFRSMKEMQKLQPKIAALREKYKDEPEKLNKEIMQLYRIHKVNPFGGCLPLIVQIPVFFALYKVLLVAIELRHAPFILWIKDLSDYDPYYITPVLMGVTMFIQQWLTPSGGDPTQEKMLYFLPVFFTIISIYFQSGLVLYWLVNNILSIVQQIFINRILREVKA